MATSSGSDVLRISAIVVTYERPEYLECCLDHLLAQTHSAMEIIVVDSSATRRSADLIAERFPSVRYIACLAGRGAIATARNLGLESATGDVIGFIDDDAFAAPDWLEQLLPYYADGLVGGVGGRQIRGQPNEIEEGLDEIGRLRKDGTLTGNFAADPGRVVEVDHLLGTNMSFRRAVLADLPGIRDGYPWPCLREETDLCFRVVASGYRLLYAPDAVVEHVAAPYAKGSRFDLRYAYFQQHNHLILLVRNFGIGAMVTRHYVVGSLRTVSRNWREGIVRASDRARHGDYEGAARAFVNSMLRGAILVVATPVGLAHGALLAHQDHGARRFPLPFRLFGDRR